MLPLTEILVTLKDDKVTRQRLYKLSSEALRTEFLNPMLAPDQLSPDAAHLNREIEHFGSRFPIEELSIKEAQLRWALTQYAPAHIDYAFGKPGAEERIARSIEVLNRITGDPVKTGDILSVAGGAIDQIIENTYHRMPVAKTVGQGGGQQRA